MTDPSNSYEKAALEYAAGMLAASTTWGLVCNEALPAKSRIVFINGGDEQILGEAVVVNWLNAEIDATPPLAQIAHDSFNEEEIGVGVRKRSGRINIGIRLSAPAGYLPANAAKWATDAIGSIKKEIVAQFGTSSKLAKGNVNSEPLTILPGDASSPGSYMTIIHIDWRA
jgi:hypothetical protein